MARKILSTAALLAALGTSSAAFHEEGVARCDGCHITHNSEEGAPVVVGPGGEALLRAESPTDVCLLCHAQGPGAVLGDDPLSPPPELGAGDFVFLLEDNLNDAPDGLTDPIPGDAAGHNLVAPGQGLAEDGRYSTAPGGSFPADRLGCTSCHDPHGNTNFRMLHGTGPVMGGAFSFTYPAPEAAGLALDGGPETDQRHTAYRQGMTAWCGNCHGRYHEDVVRDLEHPSDEPLDVEIRDQYNRYNGDADPDGGSEATAYLAPVPFEDPAAEITSTAGASLNSRVICLSCHRAHASSAPASGRWDFNVSRLGDDGLVSGSWTIPNPYPDSNQGPLCAKCHEGGAPSRPDPMMAPSMPEIP